METQEKRVRKWTGIILLIAIAVLILWFLFLTPVSPLGGDLRGAVSENPNPAPGLWGKMGFYERPADNSKTYFLIALFLMLAISQIIRKNLLPQKPEKSKGKSLSRRTLF